MLGLLQAIRWISLLVAIPSTSWATGSFMELQFVKKANFSNRAVNRQKKHLSVSLVVAFVSVVTFAVATLAAELL